MAWFPENMDRFAVQSVEKSQKAQSFDVFVVPETVQRQRQFFAMRFSNNVFAVPLAIMKVFVSRTKPQKLIFLGNLSFLCDFTFGNPLPASLDKCPNISRQIRCCKRV